MIINLLHICYKVLYTFTRRINSIAPHDKTFSL